MHRSMALRSASLIFGAVLAACADAGDDPISRPYDGALPPVVEEGVASYPTPAETLFVRRGEPGGLEGASLVFHRGRGVARNGEGEAFVPDPRASRVLVIGPDLQVARAVGGPGEEDGGLRQPLSAAPLPGGGLFVIDTEHPEGLLYFDRRGEYAGSATPPVPYADLQPGPDGSVWAGRSPYVLRFEETPGDQPLLYRFDPLEGTGIGVAAIEPVSAPGWNRVANAGPVASGPDGGAYFAFFLRNELRAYTPEGDLRWRATRTLPFETHEPVFAGAGEDLRYRVRPVTQALALGPDGLLYALTVPDSLPGLSAQGAAPGRRRLEAWDPADGALLRATTVPASWNTFAIDEEGRVHALDPDQVERGAPPPERPPLPRVSLVSFDGDSTSFAAYRGKALLVNFWASWCLPCREELPQLDAYYRTLDRDRVEFLAISTDETREAALSFIEPFDLPFPLFHGGSAMQESFGYVALPYTLIVDARGRVVEEVYGFGSSDTWERLTSLLEAEMEAVGGVENGHDPEGHGPEDPGAEGAEGEDHDHGGHR